MATKDVLMIGTVIACIGYGVYDKFFKPEDPVEKAKKEAKQAVEDGFTKLDQKIAAMKKSIAGAASKSEFEALQTNLLKLSKEVDTFTDETITKIAEATDSVYPTLGYSVRGAKYVGKINELVEKFDRQLKNKGIKIKRIPLSLGERFVVDMKKDILELQVQNGNPLHDDLEMKDGEIVAKESEPAGAKKEHGTLIDPNKIKTVQELVNAPATDTDLIEQALPVKEEYGSSGLILFILSMGAVNMLCLAPLMFKRKKSRW